MSDALSQTPKKDPYWSYPGSRWWKFDFHSHTPASHDYGKGPNHSKFRQITPKEWLIGFMCAGIDCVAITDHNTGEWIDLLKEALIELADENPTEFRPLHLFPGVEITANGNIHILAILDKEKQTADIDSLLGAIKCRSNRGASDIASDLSPIEVVQAILDRDHLPILAHVDDPNTGAWSLTGNTLDPLLDLDLSAIEVTNSEANKPELYYRKNLSLAEVLGSDSHHPDGHDGNRYPGSSYTWVKMSDPPSLEGLKLALLDGQKFSIRRSDDSVNFDPYQLPEHFINGIQISEARYMGNGKPAEIKFSPWLNAIIGGRGTGKSTVIHSLRLVSRRENELDHLVDREPNLTFNRFNRVPKNSKEEGGLKESTQITLEVTRDGVKYRVRWSLGSNIVVEERLLNDWWPSDIQAVTPERFPIRIFSQGQIAELAGDKPEALLYVIDEAAGTATHLRDLEIARRKFEELRSRIRNVGERLNLRDSILVELQDTERKLDKFKQARHAEILKGYRNRTLQERELDRQFDTIKDMAERIETVAKSLHLEDVPDGLFDKTLKEDRNVLSIINKLSEAVRTTAHALETSVKNIRERAEQLRNESTRGDWQKVVNYTKHEHNALMEQLEKEGITDPNEYGTLIQDRNRLDEEIKRLDSLREDYSRLEEQSQIQLDKVRQIRREITDARKIFLAEILAQNRFVTIQIRPYGHELQAAERSLREVLNVPDDRFSSDIFATNDGRSMGIVMDLMDGLPDEQEQRSHLFEDRISDLKHRIQNACLGNGDFGGRFNNYLKREFDKQPAFLDHILTWFPEDGLRIEYSPKGDGKNFKPIAQASAGQRSAAMLAFLLAYGNEPLILDQPEDDLDNSLIYDLVVRQIRENKLNRQIIVVTHNPNVVVNGDAEMLHALDFVHGQCRVIKSGSLQEGDIRQEICQIMEGGREAFERRYQRLGHL